MPTTSFVIVSHNRRSCLERAVASVRAHCPADTEVVVVDNASADDTWAWLEAQDDVVGIRSPVNRGPGPGRNLGVKAARGDIIFFLDDDAYLVEPVIQAGIEALSSRDRVGGVAYPIWEESLGRVIYGGRPGEVKVFAAGGAMFRREALERAGLFDENIGWSEEFDLSLRIHGAGFHLVGLERPVVHHRAVAPGTEHAGWKLRKIAAGRLRCIFTRFRWRRASLMAGRVILSVGWAGLRSGRVAPVPLAIADTVRSLPAILAERAVVPISVEEYFFRPNPLEDEFSVPLWRKLAERIVRAR